MYGAGIIINTIGNAFFLSLCRGVKEPFFLYIYKHPPFHKRIYRYWSFVGSSDTYTHLTRANSCPECDRKSSMLTVGLQLVRLPHRCDDRHAETCFAEPKCLASVPLVKNKHIPLEK